MMNYKYHSAVILVIFSVVAGCNSSAQHFSSKSPPFRNSSRSGHSFNK